MAWTDLALTPLRILINDFTSPYTYDDSTLTQLLFVAATYVDKEVSLSIDYTFDYAGFDITPDPIDDDVFFSLIILKAACLTNTWQFNSKAIMDGITAKCGPAQMTVKSDANLVLGLLKEGPCKTYEELVNQYNFGNPDIIRGILSPFISNTFLPNNIQYPNRI